MTYEATLSLAKSMYMAENPRGIWGLEDEAIKEKFMRQAAIQVAARLEDRMHQRQKARDSLTSGAYRQNPDKCR